MAKRGKRAEKGKNKKSNGAVLGFEETLWRAADKLRHNMDAAEYKHVVLGLIFLKYISDAFSERHEALTRSHQSQCFAILENAAEAILSDARLDWTQTLHLFFCPFPSPLLARTYCGLSAVKC